MINTNNAGKSFHKEYLRPNGGCLTSEAQVVWERTIPCVGYAGNLGFYVTDTISGACGVVSKISNGQEKLYVRKAVNCDENPVAKRAKELLEHERETNRDLITRINNISNALHRGPNAPSAYEKTSIANFIPILGYGHDAQNNRDYIDFASGSQSLREAIERKSFMGKKSSMSAAVNLADALFFLGKTGYVHSDLKLENILFDPTTNLLKLIDMGLAFAFRDQNRKQKSIKLYLYDITQFYCGSPEAYLLKKQSSDLVAITNPKMDVYAFGLMLPEILFGSATYQLVHCEFLGKDNPAAAKFRKEGKFYKNIAQIVNFGQNSLTGDQRYSNTQIQGFTNIIKWCLNPNPLLRPTFAQIGLYLEVLATDMVGGKELDLDTKGLTLEEIRKIAFGRPTDNQLASPDADGSLTPEAIGVYKNHPQIWTFAYDHPWTHIDTHTNMPYYLSDNDEICANLVKFADINTNIFPKTKLYNERAEDFETTYKMPTQPPAPNNNHNNNNNNNNSNNNNQRYFPPVPFLGTPVPANNINYGNNQPQFFPPQFPPANNIGNNNGNNQLYFPPVPFPVPPAPANNINYGNNQPQFFPPQFPPANNIGNNNGNNQLYFPPVHFPVPPVPANNNNQGNNQPNSYQPNPYQQQYQNPQPNPYQQNLISSPSLVVNNNQPNPYQQQYQNPQYSYPQNSRLVLPLLDLKKRKRKQKSEESVSSSGPDSSSEDISSSDSDSSSDKMKRKREKSKEKEKSNHLKKKKYQEDSAHDDEFSYTIDSAWVKEIQWVKRVELYLDKIICDIDSLSVDAKAIFNQLELKKKNIFVSFVANKYHNASSLDFMALSENERINALRTLHDVNDSAFLNYVYKIAYPTNQKILK